MLYNQAAGNRFFNNQLYFFINEIQLKKRLPVNLYSGTANVKLIH